MDSTAEVKQIQRAIVAYLATCSELEGITIIGPREGVLFSDLDQDIEAAIDAAIAESGGVCIYVPPPEIITIDGNTTGPYVDQLEPRVRCIEDPKLNTKLPDVYELYSLVLPLLHLKTFTDLQSTIGLNQFIARERPIEKVPDPTRLIRDVVFVSSCGLQPRGTQISP